MKQYKLVRVFQDTNNTERDTLQRIMEDIERTVVVRIMEHIVTFAKIGRDSYAWDCEHEYRGASGRLSLVVIVAVCELFEKRGFIVQMVAGGDGDMMEISWAAAS